MKYIKQYEGWLGLENKRDIREFFSNLKKISYLFEDYYKIQDFFQEIGDNIDNPRIPMSYFGFVNSTESCYFPIIDKVSSKLHILFPMILKNNYQGIYDWCNSDNSVYNYFEKDDKHGIYSKLENHIGQEISKYVNSDDVKPFMDIKFWNAGYNRKMETKEQRAIIDRLIEKSELNKKYNIKVYTNENTNEIRVNVKEKIKFNAEQLAEIEKAKEFGQEKYDRLKFRIENKGLIDTNNKYNL